MTCSRLIKVYVNVLKVLGTVFKRSSRLLQYFLITYKIMPLYIFRHKLRRHGRGRSHRTVCGDGNLKQNYEVRRGGDVQTDRRGHVAREQSGQHY